MSICTHGNKSHEACEPCDHVTLDSLSVITPDDGKPSFPITPAQRDALNRKFVQDPDGSESFETFCARARPTICMDSAIAIRWCSMWLAIETDGHTHS